MTDKDAQDALRTEIDVVRAELGDTVDALAAKADVKGQVKDKVGAKKAQVSADLKVKTAELKEKTADGAAQVRVQAARGQEKLAPYQPWPRVAASALAALVIALIATRAIRRRRG
jgi:hypothetical protein